MDQAAWKRQMGFNSVSNETSDTYFSFAMLCVLPVLPSHSYEKEIVKRENDAMKSRGTRKHTLQEEAKREFGLFALQKRNLEGFWLVPEYIFLGSKLEGEE